MSEIKNKDKNNDNKKILVRSNITMEHYDKLCNLFDEKLKKLLKKEVDCIIIPLNELPEIHIFSSEYTIPVFPYVVETEHRISNYAQTICEVLESRYKIKFKCCKCVTELGFELSVEEVSNE